jgi:thiamine-phosphate pyrophosphorylase
LKSPLTRPLVCLITDRRALARRLAAGSPHSLPDGWGAQLAAVRAAAEAGCQLIQVREKDLSACDLAAFVRRAVAAAQPHGARVLVNDRLDVALAAGAGGVHLRSGSMPAREVRRLVARLLPPDRAREFLVGASTHSLAEVEAAAAGGADFVVCGPVYAPTSKNAAGPLLGLDRFAEICRRVRLPVLALGNDRLDVALAAGAAGVAGIGLFQDFGSLGGLNHLRARIKMMLSFAPGTQNRV